MKPQYANEIKVQIFKISQNRINTPKIESAQYKWSKYINFSPNQQKNVEKIVFSKKKTEFFTQKNVSNFFGSS